MVYKIVTDHVRPDGRTNPYVTINEVEPGLFVVSSCRFSSNDFNYSDVIGFMSSFIKRYCGRILTATLINEGCVI